MTEKIYAKRTTPYGIQLGDDSYRNTSEAVRKFLEGKLPAELEVTAGDKAKITKVKVLGKRAGFDPEKGPATGPSDSNKYNMQMSKLKNKTNARISALECATKVVIQDETTPSSNKAEAIKTMAGEFLDFIEGGQND